MKGLAARSFTLGNRAGLSLEFALMISLFVLVCVLSLSAMGEGIGNVYGSTDGLFPVAGSVSGPIGGTGTDNGDGSYDIGWGDGTPPFRIIRDDDPGMGSSEDLGTTPDRSYTVLPHPGDNYYQVIDDDGDRLPAPIVISIPRDCYSYQDELLLLVGDFTNAGGDPGILYNSASVRSLLVPSQISATAYDDATTCPDDGSPFGYFDEFICPNHPPLLTADCDAHQTMIAQAAVQWALAEVLPSTAKPLWSPTDLSGFYAKVLPYSSTTRRQCLNGDYTYHYGDRVPVPEMTTGVFSYIYCSVDPFPPAALKHYCFVNQIAIEAAARNYRTEHGVNPPSIEALALDGFLVEPPSFCPSGEPYILSPEGTVAPCSAGSPAHGHF